MPDPITTNVAIAEALGLETKHICRDGVTIHLDGDLGPVVTVKYKFWDKDLGALYTTLKRYVLVDADIHDSKVQRP